MRDSRWTGQPAPLSAAHTILVKLYLSFAFLRNACYNGRVELNLRSHWGALVRRWIYAVGLLAPAVGLSFLTQYLWQIQWYSLFIPVGAVILLSMVYNTLNTLKVRVTHNEAGDAILITDGVFGTRTHLFAYARMESYRTKPDKLHDKMGCQEITLTAIRGLQDREEYTLCLSKEDLTVLLADLREHLPHR